METVDTIIRTKLRLPFIRPGLVFRPRLQDQIAQGLHGPFTLVTAPAGFGKTTLVAAGVNACGKTVAWLSLDKGDNQPGRFMKYLVAALQTANPTLGSEAAQLLSGTQRALSEAVLTSLINDLDAADAEIVLALDDYQFISSQVVHEEVAFLLEHCPRTLHLLMATRSDPPLPLARLRARGLMVELRATDLRFNETEAAQFIQQVMGLHLEASAVAALEARTEGWIAGLQMAGLALQGLLSVPEQKDVERFIEGFSGTNRYILDYLLEEVLANQPPETQRFLLYTSILERLTAPLCDALLSGDGPTGEGLQVEALLPGSPSEQQFAYLERENLFFIALDDTSVYGPGASWFRYHHLFADLLQARLQQTQPDLVPVLHLRASAWMEQHGFAAEAIQHLFAANELTRAADLIERCGPVRWAESDLSVIQMADNLPHDMLLERPKIGLYQAWLHINQGNIEKAFPLLMDLSQRLAQPDAVPGQRWVRTIVNVALTFLTPPASAPGLDPFPDPQQLDAIPEEEKNLRDAADLLYAMALGRRGELDQAVDFSAARIQKQTRYGIQTIPTLVPFLATAYLFQGRLHAAAALCREYLAPIREKGIRISSAGNLDVVLGEVLYEWNRLDEAEKYIRDGLRANEPWGNIMTDAFGMLVLTQVLIARRDYAGAIQVADQFVTKLEAPSRPTEFKEDFRTLKVRVQIASGNLQAASRWADQLPYTEDYQRHPQYYRLTLARHRLLQGRYAEVEELISRTTDEPWAENRVIRQVGPHLLLAAAWAGLGRQSEALELLDSCLALAEPEGHIRVFLDAGEPIRALLAAYLRLDAPAHQNFARKVLAAFSPAAGTDEPDTRQAGLVEPLSERELEVLQLMALGKTNEEIARQLVVARGTIKAHAASIYRKLDVANRTEAVMRARQLGILP